jgi:hypothetical protein
MTEASIVSTMPSVEEARVFLDQARRFMADGRVGKVSDTGRQLLLYQACLAACDAALVAAGKKVEGSDGGHVLRLRETARLLHLAREVVDLLETAREVRAGSAYAAGFVVQDDLADTNEAAELLIAEVDRFISDQVPHKRGR